MLFRNFSKCRKLGGLRQIFVASKFSQVQTWLCQILGSLKFYKSRPDSVKIRLKLQSALSRDSGTLLNSCRYENFLSLLAVKWFHCQGRVFISLPKWKFSKARISRDKFDIIFCSKMFCAKYFGSEMISLSWQGFHFTAEMEMSILACLFYCWNADVISTCFYQYSCVQVLERFGFRKNEVDFS